eukprot:TRINITY_DN781821_c0_g1_i1.p1 TRINITY_DN781821_c0_g1~~TRINITY_DN781821_c0_g1_i1.p1  ORF type:complete len:804 (-),score=207.62 TRINITY_DN781821_c0_g1_i1:224-2635(-)
MEKRSLCGVLVFWWFIVNLIITILNVGTMLPGSPLQNVSIFDREEDQNIIKPGLKLKSEGKRFKHPVILLPGVTSGALSLWEGKKCANGHFRDLFWGGNQGMALTLLLTDRRCWWEHIALKYSNDDPDGIRLRPVQGFHYADYVFPGFWVFAKLLENFSALGLDPNSMWMANHDWRLSLENVEKRDHFFTQLKVQIELLVKHNDSKAIVFTHSYGGVLLNYFMQWVERVHGDDTWVDRHISDAIMAGWPAIGTPKGIAMSMSADMKDFADMNWILQQARENFIGSDNDFLHVFRSYHSGSAMMPKGGDTMWGDETGAPDDTPNMEDGTHGIMLKLKGGHIKDGFFAEDEEHVDENVSKEKKTKLSLDEIKRIMKKKILPNPKSNHKNLNEEKKKLINEGVCSETEGCLGTKKPTQGTEESNNETNVEDTVVQCTTDDVFKPTEPPLTSAMRKKLEDDHLLSLDETYELFEEISPIYGEDFRSENDLRVAKSEDELCTDDPRCWGNPLAVPLPNAPNLRIYCFYGIGKQTERSFYYKTAEDTCSHTPIKLDLQGCKSSNETQCLNGIRYTEGDGTVPLLSLGYMCRDGWQRKHLNPAGVKVITREYEHKPITKRLEALWEHVKDSSSEPSDIVSQHEAFLTRSLEIFSEWGAAGQQLFNDVKSNIAGPIDELLRDNGQSGDHVDIMGNREFIEDILRIVVGDELEDRVLSNVDEIVARAADRIYGNGNHQNILEPNSKPMRKVEEALAIDSNVDNTNNDDIIRSGDDNLTNTKVDVVVEVDVTAKDSYAFVELSDENTEFISEE